jgi:hypothetical protein
MRTVIQTCMADRAAGACLPSDGLHSAGRGVAPAGGCCGSRPRGLHVHREGESDLMPSAPLPPLCVCLSVCILLFVALHFPPG